MSDAPTSGPSGQPTLAILDRMDGGQAPAPPDPTREPTFALLDRMTTGEDPDAYRQRKLAEARQDAARERENRGPFESSTLFVGTHSIPFVSALLNQKFGDLYQKARQRVEAGTASPDDYKAVASYEDEKQRAATESFGRSALELAGRVPAVVGEAYVGAGALRGVGLAGRATAAEAPSLLTREGALAAARAAPAHVGRQALVAPLQPSLYLETAEEGAIKSGGEATDFKNLAPAVAYGAALNSVLGSLQRVGNGVPTLAGRALAKGAVGAGEQAAVDIGASALDRASQAVVGQSLGLDTHYGVVGEAVDGRLGEAGRHAGLQTLAFGTFALMHGRPAGPVLKAADDALRSAGPDAVADIQQQVRQAAERGQTRDQFRGTAEKAPESVRPLAEALADAVLPEKAPEAEPPLPEDPRQRADALTARRDAVDERLADARRAEKEATRDRGLLYPDTPEGRAARQRADERYTAAVHARRAAQKERADIQTGLDAARDELMRRPTERPAESRGNVAEAPLAESPEPVKAAGEGGEYFRDADSFYKVPENPAHLASEPTAAKAAALLGVRVNPVEAGEVNGRPALKSPLLGDHESIGKGGGEMSKDELARLGLAEWLVHAADRNERNYVVRPGSKDVTAIDLAESWHPDTFRDKDARVGPYTSDAYKEFAGGPVPLPHDLIREALAKRGGFERLAAEGTAGLPGKSRAEALDLLRQKFDALRRLMVRKAPTLSELPTYKGLAPDEPLPKPGSLTPGEYRARLQVEKGRRLSAAEPPPEERLTAAERAAEERFARTRYEDIPADLRTRVDDLAGRLGRRLRDPAGVKDTARFAYAEAGEDGVKELIALYEKHLADPAGSLRQVRAEHDALKAANDKWEAELNDLDPGDESGLDTVADHLAYIARQQASLRSRRGGAVPPAAPDPAAAAAGPRAAAAGERTPAEGAAEAAGGRPADRPARPPAATGRGPAAGDELTPARRGNPANLKQNRTPRTLVTQLRKDGGLDKDAFIRFYGRSEYEAVMEDVEAKRIPSPFQDAQGRPGRRHVEDVMPELLRTGDIRGTETLTGGGTDVTPDPDHFLERLKANAPLGEGVESAAGQRAIERMHDEYTRAREEEENARPQPAGPTDLFGRPLPRTFAARKGTQLSIEDALRERWHTAALEYAQEHGLTIERMHAGGTFEAGGRTYRVGPEAEGYPVEPVGGELADEPATAGPSQEVAPGVHFLRLPGAVGRGVNRLLGRGRQPRQPGGAGPTPPARGGIGDELKSLLAPATRGEAAETGAGILRANLAELARKKEVARQALSSAEALFDARVAAARNDPQRLRDQFLELTDAIESGDHGALPPELRSLADTFRRLQDERTQAAVARGLLDTDSLVENYFGHLWADPANPTATPGEVGRTLAGRRPLAGPEAFRKRRTLPTWRDGIDAGLVPRDWNPVRLMLAKLHEVDRAVMAKDVVEELKANRMWQFVRLGGKAPADWRTIDDRLARVFAPPEVKLTEYFDKKQMEGLEAFARSLGLNVSTEMRSGHVVARGVAGGLPRPPGRPSGVLGASFGDEVVRKFGTPEEVLAHEIGHQIDARYGIARGLRRPEFQSELNALADLRASGRVSPEYQAYLRSPPEQVANLIAGYLHAPELTRRVAPRSVEWLEALTDSHEELRPLREIKPSLELGQREQHMRLAGPMLTGHYYTPEPVARLLDNYLSPGLSGSRLFNLARNFGNLLNQMQLGFSAFHAGFVAMDAQVSAAARGLQLLSRGEFSKAGRALVGGLVPGVAPVRAWVEGSKLLREYFAPGSQGAEAAAVLDAIVQAGGRARMDAFYGGTHLEAFRKALREVRAGDYGKAGRVVLNALPAVADAVSYPVMQELVPRMKLGVMADLARDIMAKNPGKSPVELRAELGRAWDSVDNRLGQLTYDNLFWNRTLKDGLMVAVRSVGWNLGTVRELGGGVRDIPAGLKGLSTGEGVGPRLAYAVALPVVTAIYGAIYNYLATGEAPKEARDYFFPRTGRKRADGSDDRVSLPSYVKDVAALTNRADEGPVRLASNAWAMLSHKLHPGLTLVAEMLENRDFYGKAIYDPADPTHKKLFDLAAHVVGSFESMSSRTLRERRKQGLGPAEQAQGFVGITPAPSYVVHTAEEQRAAERARKVEQTPLGKLLREREPHRTPTAPAGRRK